MKFHIALLVILAFLSCGTKKETQMAEQSKSQLVRLHFSEQKSADHGLMLAFENVVEDSRCPADVNCIWEGDAEVQLALVTGIELVRFNLHTNPRFTNDTLINGTTISLKSLEPYPASSSNIEKSKYEIVLQIESQ
jgi:hypothetical protein